ncbi:hypothetical protein ACFQU7_35500 [Pseudoroseomonas wenyumeiae]
MMHAAAQLDFALTPVAGALADPRTEELCINRPGEFWLRQGGRFERHAAPSWTSTGWRASPSWPGRCATRTSAPSTRCAPPTCRAATVCRSCCRPLCRPAPCR